MKSVRARLSLLSLTIALLAVLFTACSKEKSFEQGAEGGAGRNREYPLVEVNGSGVNGTVRVAENADSSITITVTLEKSIAGETHVLHLHNGTTESPGTIAITLAPVTGTGNRVQSITNNITEAVAANGTIQPLTFDELITMEGFVDVHQNVTQQQTVLAEGKIGI